MRAWLVVLAAGGCYNPTLKTGAPCATSSDCPGDQQCVAGHCGGAGADMDAGFEDAAIDAPALCTTWTAHHFAPCDLPAPIGSLNLNVALSGYSWDTDAPVLKGKMNTTIDVATMVMQQDMGPEVLVASVEDFVLEDGATLDVNGSRPLLVAVWGTAVIDGSIDADANFASAGPGGSGGVTAACGSGPTGNFGAAGAPATGAGGGAFQGDGGRGGNTGGGPGIGITPPTIIQGGCAGGAGGAGSTNQGTRGAGGGAVQITARLSIAIGANANIHAGGGGGGGGQAALGAGGGGGGGGFIGFDAPTVDIAGIVTANGGGGGGGASDVAVGSSGANGRSDASAALGGAGAATSNVGACGKGGNGSSGGTLAGMTGTTSSCGGGGGGGGAGYILIWSPALNLTGTVSPPVTAGP